MIGRSTSRSQTFESVLVRQCAPTLAGIKPGSIFSFNRSPLEISRQKVRQWDERLAPLGLAVQILLERPCSSWAIVYVYRRTHLERLLSGNACQRFLAKAGYAGTDLDGLLDQLARRLQTQPEFPHEIGVFLDYPIDDVRCFMEQKGKGGVMTGYWKVYHNPGKAQLIFQAYDKARISAVNEFLAGGTIREIACKRVLQEFSRGDEGGSYELR